VASFRLAFPFPSLNPPDDVPLERGFDQALSRPAVVANSTAKAFASQRMHFCRGLASHATVIDKGQIVYTSGIEELKANENIRQRYLAL
jgi:hypothetical protein